MARTRSIKPGFFTNDQLAEIEPLGRLLFAGLWTQADRAGRLLDRPRKLKAELLPYDDCDIDALLAQLAARGFIVRYVVDDVALIQVVTWVKHQQPHINEKPSELPPPAAEAPEQNGTSTGPVPEQNGANTPGTRNPEPGTRNPEPGTLPPGTRHPEDEDAPAAAAVPEAVEVFHQRLVGTTGYDPSPAFLRKVAAKYGDLDLEEEALKLISWLRSSKNRQKQTCTTGFVLKWLGKASAPETGEGVAGQPRASPVSGVQRTSRDSRNPRDYFQSAARR